MMRRASIGLCAGALLAAGCETTDSPTEALETLDVELRQALARGPYGGAFPIGTMPAQPPAQVALGRALFFDPVLSGNKDVACATCHHPSTALGDGLSLSVGTGGTGTGAAREPGPGRELVPRNAPTLLNVGLGLPYMMWDARVPGFAFGAPTVPEPVGGRLLSSFEPLVQQAFLPVLDRKEMRGEEGDTDVLGQPNELAAFPDTQHTEIWAAIVDRLLAVPEYVGMLDAAFPSVDTAGVRYEHVAQALAAFEAEAFTMTRSPFDRYLEHDDAALTTHEKRGALLFFGDAQCSTCHAGPFLGGQGFHNVGAPQIGPGVGKEPPLDLGIGERVPEDAGFYRFAFRAPPLRNVELTAPYMHSGAYATLEAVVRHYSDVPKALREYDLAQLDADLRGMHHGGGETVADILATVDSRLREPLELDDRQQSDLVAFLRSLTDPAARDLDHLVPASVPSGLPVGN